MESDRRMLDAQRRSVGQSAPVRRVTPGWSEQTRPADGPQSIRPQDAQECDQSDNAAGCGQTGECAARQEKPCHAERNTGAAGIAANLSGEELLIAALLILAISEGSELSLILALFYLLL